MTAGSDPTLFVPKGTAQAMQELTGEPRPEVALLLVLRDAYAHRLEQIEAELASFEAKYGMPFEAYRAQWETGGRDEDYAWETERDYLEWEGLVTQKQRLEDTFRWLS